MLGTKYPGGKRRWRRGAQIATVLTMLGGSVWLIGPTAGASPSGDNLNCTASGDGVKVPEHRAPLAWADLNPGCSPDWSAPQKPVHVL